MIRPNRPVQIIKRIGLSLYFRSANKETEKTTIAIQSISLSISNEVVPKKVRSNRVAAAEIISPKEADFSPFKTSKT